MKKLPYRAQTATGAIFDIEFPLHGETGDAVRVGQVVSLLLGALEKDIALAGETSNGDVLQALAMAMAIRAGMIHAPHETTARLAKSLLSDALEAMENSARRGPEAGHA